jgi:hypothetical protein
MDGLYVISYVRTYDTPRCPESSKSRATWLRPKNLAFLGRQARNCLDFRPRIWNSDPWGLLFRFALARRLGLAVLVAEHGFAREFDLVALAADALHQDLLAFFQLVPNVFHTPVRYL